MKKAILAFFLAAVLVASAVDVVPGVSRDLARERKACLDSINYSIAFHYPINETNTFVVDEEILFHYSGGLVDFLQIDFDGEKLGSCQVNGIEISPEWKANHILIPAGLLHVGKNSIQIQCVSNNKALNANPNYMYTLFVPANAHSAFPCFDQPDLKATFSPTLHIPKSFQCMSSMSIESVEIADNHDTKMVTFKESPKLPTYLMSWVIGDFKKADVDGMTILHNETDPLKVAQIPDMCEISSKAIGWLEDYTQVPYPFEKYDFAIIPGFQFGGMEHPGDILYLPETMFLSQSPTPEEILKRYELIAHETSHMWFGDLVTMRWFDDVWTKEVFANFMASKISSEAFPEIDHNFNFIRGNYPAAYFTDRTDGTHPIAQNLENLNKAGLVYGNIIYNKAPIMMRMLEKRMGEERLRDGLRVYLEKYAMANSSWDELIVLLDSIAPDADVRGFSEAWVKQMGFPEITTVFNETDKCLTVTQEDPTGEGTVWPQSFTVRLIGTNSSKDIDIDLFEKSFSTPIDTFGLGNLTAIIPNSHGDGYGHFKLANMDDYFSNWALLENDGRYAAILNLENAWVKKDVDSKYLQGSLSNLMPSIDNPIIAAQAADVLATMATQNTIGEDILWDAFDTTQHSSVKQKLLRSIYSLCISEPSTARISDIWQKQSDSLLNQRDYMAMAYRLAILQPQDANRILEIQRGRIADNPNLVREFDFIRRACTTDTDSLLRSLKMAENRQPEPWTAKSVALIFDPARSPSNSQIKFALELLPEIQATGGIFFPINWAKAIMAGIRTPENKQFISDYCQSLNPSDPLNRKLLETTYLLRTFVHSTLP